MSKTPPPNDGAQDKGRAQEPPTPEPLVTAAPYLGSTVIVQPVKAIGERPTVGKYEIIKELGRGGMGIVYQAFDPGIGRTVALKVMSEHLARNVEFRNRFLREARGAGILQHPNIVTIHELGEWQGAPFIAMEFLEGRSLEDIIKNEKTMPLEKRVGIVAQVCRGLDYAHARGVVHRDIKPANIMVTTEGVAKIVDFGIVRLADQQLNNAGKVIGTVSYMSPEQLHGKTLDGRSDIFAVGVVLFQALTSVLPFTGENTGVTITSILYGTPPSLSSFLPNYPKDLDEIIGKCLAKNPDDRFQTAGELADRLSLVEPLSRGPRTPPTRVQFKSTPINAYDAPKPPRTLIVPRHNSRNIMIGAAVLGFILVGGLALTMYSGQTRTDNSSGNPPTITAPEVATSQQTINSAERPTPAFVSADEEAKRSIIAFIDEVLAASEAPPETAVQQFYTDTVSPYYTMASAPSSSVIESKERYAQRFPKRHYAAVGAFDVRRLSDSEAIVKFALRYSHIRSDGKVVKGTAYETWNLALIDRQWKISGVSEFVK